MENSLRFFRNWDEFVRALAMTQEYLGHCIECGVMWVNPKAIKKLGMPSDEIFQLAQLCCRQASEMYLTIRHFREWGIEELTSGSCSLCVREEKKNVFKRVQRLQGHFDCFSSAIGGCSQGDCLYINTCVVQAEDLRRWHQRVSVFHEAILAERQRLAHEKSYMEELVRAN